MLGGRGRRPSSAARRLRTRAGGRGRRGLVRLPWRPAVLEDVSLTVGKAGASSGIAGPNGGGKTTLLRLCARARAAGVGSVRVFGRAAGGAARPRADRVPPAARAARAGTPVTVREPVEAGALAVRGPFGPLRAEDRMAVARRSSASGSATAPARRCGRSPEAMQQRAYIAQALATEPRSWRSTSRRPASTPSRRSRSPPSSASSRRARRDDPLRLARVRRRRARRLPARPRPRRHRLRRRARGASRASGTTRRTPTTRCSSSSSCASPSPSARSSACSPPRSASSSSSARPVARRGRAGPRRVRRGRGRLPAGRLARPHGARFAVVGRAGDRVAPLARGHGGRPGARARLLYGDRARRRARLERRPARRRASSSSSSARS